MILFFKSRQTARQFAQKANSKGLMFRVTDKGTQAPTGRRWGVSVKR